MDWVVPEAADERTHTPADDPLWGESWYFDFARPDGSLGGYVRIGLYPNQGKAWYWACLVGEDRPPLMVVDHEAGLPSTPGSRQIRSSGLWADHTCEEALERWSLGCEAFALQVEDPRELYRDEPRGDRVPFGFELEWESDGRPFRYTITDRYEIPCRVHGEVLVGDETIEVEALGERDHSWGVRDWWIFDWVWSAFHTTDGRHLFGNAVELSPDFTFRTGFSQRSGGTEQVALDDFTPTFTGLDDGLVDGISWTAGENAAEVTVVDWGPLLLVAPDGRRSNFARALCRARLADGTDAVGWMEFNQPER
jgi:hypothetical protein